MKTFRQIVQEIEDAQGWDDEQLAAQVGTHRTTISRLRTGSTLVPNFFLGDALHKLHDKRTTKPGRKAK